MTRLSVNLNKIALLRNARGRDYPSVLEFAKRFVDLGVHGITIHPRPDQRHIKTQDAYDLAAYLRDIRAVELNIEGYPSAEFLRLVEAVQPQQCTLVPDSVDQLTSDHGWRIDASEPLLTDTLKRLQATGVRAALFMEADSQQLHRAAELGYPRIELYTEAYAAAFGRDNAHAVWQQYQQAAKLAQSLGLGVNAGHDLNQQNLAEFLRIGGILEVSIGHALSVECIEQGIEKTTQAYLDICRAAPDISDQ